MTRAGHFILLLSILILLISISFGVSTIASEVTIMRYEMQSAAERTKP